MSPCFRLPGQDEDQSLEKCFARMNLLSDVITSSCNHRRLRIVLANQGPSCFLAKCLLEYCTTVRPSDIVVVAADEGLSCLNVVSEKTGIPVAQMSAPPVWGFIGMNSFIDLKHIVLKGDVYRPNVRSLTAPRGTTLPLGTIKSELRLMSYLIADHDEIVRVAEERKKKIVKIFERPPLLSKIRAIISLLKLWFAEVPSTDIISLGVCSNGSFGIPPGLVFSQPVMLDSKSRWVPFTEFPLMDETTHKEISVCIDLASQTLRKFGLWRHMCKDEEDICSNPDCPMNIRVED